MLQDVAGKIFINIQISNSQIHICSDLSKSVQERSSSDYLVDYLTSFESQSDNDYEPMMENEDYQIVESRESQDNLDESKLPDDNLRGFALMISKLLFRLTQI